MSQQSYWEEFYRKVPHQTSADTYDWFFPYQVAQPWLHQYIKQQTIQAGDQEGQRSLKVMDLGCGTSDLSTHLFADNPSLQITCVDFSEEAIKKMQRTFGHLEPQKESSPGITFVQGDATCLPFKDQTFDICYEKGTVDAILKQKTHGTSKAVGVICEIARVLKPAGVLLQFSDEPPELRLPLLESAKWELITSQNRSVSISFKEISNFSGIEFFLYTMQDAKSVSIQTS
jgi:ubiquinone/menaquinone biosynthesis C-methylase UbiE